jgi:hypothetical protein
MGTRCVSVTPRETLTVRSLVNAQLGKSLLVVVAVQRLGVALCVAIIDVRREVLVVPKLDVFCLTI